MLVAPWLTGFGQPFADLAVPAIPEASAMAVARQPEVVTGLLGVERSQVIVVVAPEMLAVVAHLG